MASAASSSSDSAPWICSPLISPTGRNSTTDGLLGQRVDEPRGDNLDLVHLSFQKQVAGKGGDRPGLGESRRVARR